jgi:hypothetical protein
MSKQKHAETLAVTANEAARAPAPVSLPFRRPASEGGHGGVVCASLPAPEGAAAVPFALDTVPWRKESALHLTVVVKTSFSAASLPMTPAAEAPRFLPADFHHRNQPMQHVVAASDRVPWKTNVDVTVLGHACAPAGQKVPELYARFAVLSPTAILLDKKVRVVGKKASRDAAPEAFSRMPVTYGKAFGGPATPTNPIGSGDDPDDDPPNILDVANPWRPAGFGPISAAWPVRHRLLRDLPRRLLDGPVMELPRGFDWTYFQSAPPDQQLAELPDGATFVLESFDENRPRIELALPRAEVVGAVYGLDPEHPEAASELGFRLDTVHVDADAWLVTLTFRAYVEVADDATLGRLLVAAGVGLDGKVPVVPAERPSAAGGAEAASDAGAAPAEGSRRDKPGSGTLDFTHSSEPLSLPFGKPPRAVVAPAAQTAAAAPEAAQSPAGVAAAAQPAVTAPPAAPFPAASPSASRRRDADRTLVLPSRPAVAAPAVPFTGVAPGTAPPQAAVPAVPFTGVAAGTAISQAAVPAGPPVPAPVMAIPVLAPVAPAPPVPSAPPVDVPVAYTADIAKPADLRGATAQAAPEKKAPEEEVDIDRYGALSAALDEPKAKLAGVLEENHVDLAVWRAADKHWRRAMDHETRRGLRGLRERFDDAYVAAWDKAHPGRFALGHYARLAHAEQQGLLSVELSDQGLTPNLGMRLRRVWRRRISQNDALREQLDRELAVLRADF